MDNLLGEFFGTMVLMVFGCGVCGCNTLTGSKDRTAAGFVLLPDGALRLRWAYLLRRHSAHRRET